MTKIYCKQAQSGAPKSLAVNIIDNVLHVTASYDVDGLERVIEKQYQVSDFALSDKDWQAYFINFQEHHDGIGAPVATNQLTIGEKINRDQYTLKHQITPALIVFAPYALSKVGFGGASIIARVINPDLFQCNQEFVVADSGENDAIRASVYSPITFSAEQYEVNSGESVTLHLNHPATADVDLDVYLESTGGLLPLTRAKLTPSGVDVRFVALGMQPGDVCKVKAGFYDYPAVASCTITVK